MEAFKLFRLRKDGTLGPLFINARLRVPMGVWLDAGCHPTKGYAVRRGWHCTLAPVAPHLSSGPQSGRVWCRCEVEDYQRYARPESQGGTWLLAERIRILEILEG